MRSISSHIPKERIVVGISCSLLHTPFSKQTESKIDSEILSWLSFAIEKIQELLVLEDVFKNGITAFSKDFWEANIAIHKTRANSSKTNNPQVRQRVANITKTTRDVPFAERIKIQKQNLKYPNLATTTIGSFPQTPELRALRLEF